jgi:hypothetical protein
MEIMSRAIMRIVYSPHMSFDFQGRRVHDYNFLIKRSISLAREIGLNAQVYATAEHSICFASVLRP